MYYKNKFLETFKKLCETRASWQVWADFVTATACALANTVDRGEHYKEREKEYIECAKRIGDVEKMAELFSYVVSALEENPNQDFFRLIIYGVKPWQPLERSILYTIVNL